MPLAERAQVLERVIAAPDLVATAILARQGARHVLELRGETATAFFGASAGAVEESGRQYDLVVSLLLDLVLRIGDDAERGKRVGDDLVVGERLALSEPTRNSGVEERSLESGADFVLSIKQRDVSPRQLAIVRGAVAAQIVDDPVRFGLIVGKRESRHRERRRALR